MQTTISVCPKIKEQALVSKLTSFKVSEFEQRIT